MQQYVREFLYWVCLFNFHPIVSKISTKENYIADFLSRNFDESDAEASFFKENLPAQNKIFICEDDFILKAKW